MESVNVNEEVVLPEVVLPNSPVVASTSRDAMNRNAKKPKSKKKQASGKAGDKNVLKDDNIIDDDGDSTNHDFSYLLNIRNADAQEKVDSIIKAALSNNENVDNAIRELLKLYSIDVNTCISLVSIESKFTLKISATDYEQVVNYLWIANSIALQQNQTLKASLAVCDPLPFTKFYIDLDCEVCHSAARKSDSTNSSFRSHFEHAEINGRSAVLDIVREMQMFFPQNLDYVVATKSKRPWCGIHLYFMVNLDVIMKKLIFNHLIKLKFKVHKIDITHNGVLPFCRDYDMFFDAMFKPMVADENLLKKISYIDVWRKYPTHYYLPAMSKDDISESIMAEPPSKRVCKGLNSTLEVHLMSNQNHVNTIYFSLWNGLSYSDDETDTYRELINNNSTFTHLTFRNSNSSHVQISLNDINNFSKFAQSNNSSQIISLTKIEEYYQQKVPVSKVNYNPKLNYDVEDELANLPPLTVCSEENRPERKARRAPALLAFRDHVLRPDYEIEDANNEICKDYVEITSRNLQVLDSILADESINNEMMIDVLQKVFSAENLSLYDIVISVAALQEIPHELVDLCNLEIQDGLITEEPVPNAPGPSHSRRGGSTAKIPPKPSNHAVRLHFDGHSATIYSYFKDLFAHALMRNHTMALLSYVQQNCQINSKTLLKLFVQILSSEWVRNQREERNQNDYIQTQISIRKSMKLILGLYDCDESYAHENFLKSFDGNEMFFAAWNFKPNQNISDMYTAISNKLLSLRISNSTSQFKHYFTENIMHMRTVGDKIQFFNGRGREMLESVHFVKRFNSIENITGYADKPSLCCSYQCFAYYSSIGLVHPTLRVVERAGPCLLNKIYREFDKTVEERHIYPNPKSYLFMRDAFFKVHPFIQEMRKNIIGLILLGPVINVVIDPVNYHFKSLFNPVVNSVNVLITDLSNIYSMNWSPNFIKELQVQSSQHSMFGRMWNCWLSFMMTLHRTYQFTTDAVRSDPMRVIINLFGSNDHQGFRPSRTIDNNTVQVNTGVNGDNKNDNDSNSFSITDDIYNDPAEGLTLPANGEALFHYRVKKLIENKKNEYISNWDANSTESMCAGNSFSLYTHYEVESQKILTQVVFAECFNSAQFNFDAPPPLNFRGIAPNFQSTPPDFIKLCFILFSWIVRMGDVHRYSNVPFMQKIINCRGDIYDGMSKCVLKYFNVEYVNRSAQNHADILREYCESVDLDYTQLEWSDPNEIRPHNSLFEDDISHRVYANDDQLTLEDKKAVYSALSDVIIFSNYDHDCFVDLCKVIAGLEFSSNYLKRMHSFYGRSSGGKNVFLDKLKYSFNCCDKIKLSNKHYGDISTDHNPNIAILGTSLLVNLDEPPNQMKVSEMKNDVNIFDVSTRNIHGRDTERYQITAKMFITSNEMVGPNTADEGWFKRLMLFPVRHSFCELKKKIYRSSAQIGGATENESSEHLIAQILTGCYPECGNAPNIVSGITITSFVFFRRFFFFKPHVPTSFAISDCAKRQIYSYMMQYSPLFEFLNTTVITPSEQAMDATAVHDFVKNWGSVYRKPNVSQLYKDIKTFLIPYMAGNVYYARMEIRTKDNRL